MKINDSTFCAAPWFQLRNSSLGNYRACCSITQEKSNFAGQIDYKWPTHSTVEWMNSDYMHYLRQELTNGNRLPECDSCWQHEDHQIISQRQILNNTITYNQGDQLNQTWIKSYFNNKTDYAHDLLLIADIKLTNLCNFACAMCVPKDSTQIYSQWRKNKKHPWVIQQLQKNPEYLEQVKQVYINKHNHQLLQYAIQKQVRHIKILGGEPLLDQVAMNMLSTIDLPQKARTSLIIITNGSVDLDATCQQLGDFQTIQFIISLEGIGDVQDYIRKGSSWTQIEKNIDNFLTKYSNSKNNLRIHHTVQALSLYHLHKLVSWCDLRNIQLSTEILINPEYMSVSVMPEQMRLECFQNLIDTRPALVESIQKIDHRADLKSQLQDFLTWYDPSNTWQNIFPEWRLELQVR
jgi:molybdenum cofactor biosynthesis enzyme MoaA